MPDDVVNAVKAGGEPAHGGLERDFLKLKTSVGFGRDLCRRTRPSTRRVTDASGQLFDVSKLLEIKKNKASSKHRSAGQTWSPPCCPLPMAQWPWSWACTCRSQRS